MATNRQRAASTARTRRSRADTAQALEDLSQHVSIAELQQKVERLTETVVGLAGLSAIDNVLSRGFETLIAELAPLKELTTKHQLLDQDQNARLTALRRSLACPKWTSSGALPIMDKPVAFIFASVPDPLLAQDTASYWNPGQGRN